MTTCGPETGRWTRCCPLDCPSKNCDLGGIDFHAYAAAHQVCVDYEPILAHDPDELSLSTHEGTGDHLDSLSGNIRRFHRQIGAAACQYPHCFQLLPRHCRRFAPTHDEPAGAADTTNFLQLIQARLNEHVAREQGYFERGSAILPAADHTMPRQVRVDFFLLL